MTIDRRDFLKGAGVAALAIAAKPALDIVAAATLPEESPLVGKRWAMVIDLRKCISRKNCTACITACHKTHNVPDFGNPKDEIKWIWKEDFEHVFLDQANEYTDEALKNAPAVLLCNHCDNPPCVRVCPTKATWKRKEDGIVMMDWHRCIGCRYCVAACPYGSRSFNWRNPRPFIKELKPDFPTRMRGVVEKCTLCEERLAKGLLPVCVEACEAKAMVFGDLENPNSEVRKLLAERFSIRRKPALGTQPQVYYLV
jgi:molybdopterin-containing oxidoreductase family iron-sulfur binding subunit